MIDEVDAEIYTMFRRIADAAPPAPELDDWPTPPRSTRRPRIVAIAAAAVIVAVGVAGAVVVAGRAGRQPPEGGSPPTAGAPARQIEVEAEHLVYRQTDDLTCADPITSSDGFNRAVIWAYADRSGQRWANVVTYPDGSRREVIAFGDAFYPQRLAERGERRGAELGCRYDDGDLILAAEPAQGSFYSLNPHDDIPRLNGESMVPGYRELGTRLPGHREIGGQTVEVWRQRIDGFWEFGGRQDVPGTQITEWFVEPGTGTVWRWRFTTTIDGVGTVTETVNLLEWGGILHSEDVFNETGYRALPVPEDPRDGTAAGSSTLAPTVSVSSATVNGTCDTYTVQTGDYPVGIAERFNITYEQLLAANPNFDDVFTLGGRLAIPCP